MSDKVKATLAIVSRVIRTALTVAGLIVVSVLTFEYLHAGGQPWYVFVWRGGVVLGTIALVIADQMKLIRFGKLAAITIFTVDAALMLAADGNGIALGMRSIALNAAKTTLVPISQYDVPLHQRASLRAVLTRMGQDIAFSWTWPWPDTVPACEKLVAQLEAFTPPLVSDVEIQRYQETIDSCGPRGVDVSRLRAEQVEARDRARIYRAGGDPDVSDATVPNWRPAKRP
jgi:hypothetical protein